jgi:methylmalonyl-CoA mutase
MRINGYFYPSVQNHGIMKTPLFSEFAPITKSEWLAKIEKDLKGKPIADLQLKLGDLSLDPFPHQDDLQETPTPLNKRGNWEIAEDIPAHDILAADHTALGALEGGVEALRFVLDENLGDHRMESLLEGIQLDAVSIHFYERNKNARPLRLLTHYYHVAKARGFDTRSLRGSVNWQFQDTVVTDDALEMLEFCRQKLPNFKVLPVHADRFHTDENGVVTELTKTVAAAVRWVDALGEKHVLPEEVNSSMQFSILIGKNYFVEMAKIRALRHLWANILMSYRAENPVMPPIEAQLAPTVQTSDPNYNIIQSTTQAMAAIIGGVDRLTVLPSDAFQGATTDFSRRIARNVQHILKMESYLDWVADPAAGSYFIEKLTLHLAEAAWNSFQQLPTNSDSRYQTSS